MSTGAAEATPDAVERAHDKIAGAVGESLNPVDQKDIKVATESKVDPVLSWFVRMLERDVLSNRRSYPVRNDVAVNDDGTEMHPATGLFQCKTLPTFSLSSWMERIARHCSLDEKALAEAVVEVYWLRYYIPSFPCTAFTVWRIFAVCTAHRRFPFSSTGVTRSSLQSFFDSGPYRDSERHGSTVGLGKTDLDVLISHFRPIMLEALLADRDDMRQIPVVAARLLQAARTSAPLLEAPFGELP